MTELYSNITNINIDNTSDFFVESIIKYQNLSSLILNNIKINSYEIINQLFDNLNLHKINLLDCNFEIDLNKITIKLVNNKITLYLFNINDTVVKKFLKNLPQCIEYIYIEQIIGVYSTRSILDNSFVNLPSNLQNIEIKYLYNTFIKSTRELENEGIFNCLFKAKLPFGCEMIVKVNFFSEEVLYKVIYENNLEDTLTLINKSNLEEQIIIKEFKIHYNFGQNDTQNYNILRIMSGMGGLGYSS